MPKFSSCRPDFMAFGPHIMVRKDKSFAFSALERAEPDDDDDDTPTYRYYESDKILGKLFRAIDEHEIFADVQQSKSRKEGNSVLSGILKYIERNCSMPFVRSYYMGRARGIREE